MIYHIIRWSSYLHKASIVFSVMPCSSPRDTVEVASLMESTGRLGVPSLFLFWLLFFLSSFFPFFFVFFFAFSLSNRIQTLDHVFQDIFYSLEFTASIQKLLEFFFGYFLAQSCWNFPWSSRSTKAHPLSGLPMKIQMSETTAAILEMVCQYGPVSMHHVKQGDDIVMLVMSKEKALKVVDEDDFCFIKCNLYNWDLTVRLVASTTHQGAIFSSQR